MVKTTEELKSRHIHKCSMDLFNVPKQVGFRTAVFMGNKVRHEGDVN